MDLSNYFPFRPKHTHPNYAADLYVELEIHPDEDPDVVPCAARPIGEGEAWIMTFGVYYAMGDLPLAKNHADVVVKPDTRKLWTARVRRIADGKTLYTVGQKAGEESRKDAAA